jgi:hypothetical protein
MCGLRCTEPSFRLVLFLVILREKTRQKSFDVALKNFRRALYYFM